MADPQLFRQTGLIPLKKVYDAYPATFEGSKFCVLLPLGLLPRDVGNLDESGAAAKKIVVLKQEKDRWTKVFPSADSASAEEPAPVQTQAPMPQLKVEPKPEPTQAEGSFVIEEE